MVGACCCCGNISGAWRRSAGQHTPSQVLTVVHADRYDDGGGAGNRPRDAAAPPALFSSSEILVAARLSALEQLQECESQSRIVEVAGLQAALRELQVCVRVRACMCACACACVCACVYV